MVCLCCVKDSSGLLQPDDQDYNNKTVEKYKELILI